MEEFETLLSRANEIAARDLFFGELISQVIQSYLDGRYLLALTGLFILAEHGLKRSLDLDEGNFSAAIEGAKKERIITHEESVVFHQLREWRNMLFHEDAYGRAIRYGGLIYLLSETDTHELMFEQTSPIVIEVIERIGG